MNTKTLQQQFQDHNKNICQQFKKRSMIVIVTVVFFDLLLLCLNYYFFWQKHIFWLLIVVMFIITYVVYIEIKKTLFIKEYIEYARLESDYEQAKYFKNLEENHTGGELSYDTIWCYTFYW